MYFDIPCQTYTQAKRVAAQPQRPNRSEEKTP